MLVWAAPLASTAISAEHLRSLRRGACSGERGPLHHAHVCGYRHRALHIKPTLPNVFSRWARDVGHTSRASTPPLPPIDSLWVIRVRRTARGDGSSRRAVRQAAAAPGLAISTRPAAFPAVALPIEAAHCCRIRGLPSGPRSIGLSSRKDNWYDSYAFEQERNQYPDQEK